jgi:hypothetical protein
MCRAQSGIESTGLERVASRTLDNPKEQSVNITSFIIDEQSIIILLTFFATVQGAADKLGLF